MCIHTHYMVKKLPVLGEVLKIFMLEVQSQEHFAIKYYFQERNQHALLVLIAIFAFEYWVLDFLPLPMLNSMLVWLLNTTVLLFLLSEVFEGFA